MDLDPQDRKVVIKTEPTEPTLSKAADASSTNDASKASLTKGGVKKRTFAPKASVRKAKPDPLDAGVPIKKEGVRIKKEWKDGDSSRGRGRGRGSGRGRGMVTMQASGPFSMGPAGLGSTFKKANAIYRSSGPGGSGGGGGGGHGSYDPNGRSTQQSSKSNFNSFLEEENREEYEDADIMTHYEGGEEIKQDPESNKEQTKEEIKAEEVARQLQGLDLSSDKLSVFADSLDAAKSENGPNCNLFFFQFPAVLPTLIGQNANEEKMKAEVVKKENPEENDVKTEAIKKEIDDTIEKQQGHVGKLRFCRSGKVQLAFGDIVFDVTNGLPCEFYQEAVVLDKERQYVCALGNIKHRFVCSPNVVSLLESSPPKLETDN